MIIDTHCHLYAVEFRDDLLQVLRRAKEVQVDAVFMPNIDLESIPEMLNVSKNNILPAYPMMGLHPCYVKDNFEQVLREMMRWFDREKFYAIGEIGIDLYWDKTWAENQMKSFEYQIGLALELDLPIIIHSREALDITIGSVTKFQKGNLRGIFHCFSGTAEQLRQIEDLGFLIGIGGVVTYKKAGLLELINEYNPKNIVFETDAPYLAPVPHRGKRNEPAYLTQITRTVSDIYSEKGIDIIKIAYENSKKIFGI